MNPLKEQSNKNNQPNSYVKYSGLGFQMLVTIGVGIWGGIKLDQWLGNHKFPICTVVLSLVSIIGSLILFIRSLPKE